MYEQHNHQVLKVKIWRGEIVFWIFILPACSSMQACAFIHESLLWIYTIWIKVNEKDPSVYSDSPRLFHFPPSHRLSTISLHPLRLFGNEE